MNKQPTFLGGLIGSVIPLGLAIIVSIIAGVLVYTFWFGTDWIMDFLF